MPPNPMIATEVIADGPLFPNMISTKCPAIMFAVRRIACVPGRIVLLIVSMITINGINIVGVHCGTKCSIMCLIFLIKPNNINFIHGGSAKVSVSVRCLIQELIFRLLIQQIL
jgi:hypothetical protein